MKTPAHAVLYLRLRIGSIALVLLGLFGIAAVIAWMPGSTEAGIVFALDKLPPPPAKPVGARVRVKCAECGVVVSTREIEQFSRSGGGTSGGQNEILENPPKSYEVTIRMKDGSSRVFIDANSVNWQPGERIIFIQGANQLSN